MIAAVAIPVIVAAGNIFQMAGIRPSRPYTCDVPIPKSPLSRTCEYCRSRVNADRCPNCGAPQQAA